MQNDVRFDARFFKPPEEFAGRFTSFYRVDIDVPEGRTFEDHLHPEWTNVRFFRGARPTARVGDGPAVGNLRIAATGPSSRPTYFSLGSTRIWGIGMLPLAWACWGEGPARAVADQVVEGAQHPAFVHFAELLDELEQGEPDDAREYDAIVDFFRRRPVDIGQFELVRRVHDVLLDPELCSTQVWADRLGINRRRLERICARYFGFSPKLLIRRQRLMRTLARFLVESPRSWSQVIDGQYVDQAHFIHDFRDFMGVAPTDYMDADHPLLTHFVRVRSAATGAAFQVLDGPRSRVD